MAKKSKEAEAAKAAKKYAKLFTALADLSSVLEELESENDPKDRALSIKYNPVPAAMVVEGGGKKFVLRLDDIRG